MLSASVLIDLDHLPEQFGSSILTAGTPRPYTHALWVAVVLAAATVAACRRHRATGGTRAGIVTAIAAGATWGVSAHFLRDVATAPISLWWPLSDAGVQVRYWWYLGALLVLAVLPPRHPGHGDRPGRAGEFRATRRGTGGPGREPAPWRPG